MLVVVPLPCRVWVGLWFVVPVSALDPGRFSKMPFPAIRQFSTESSVPVGARRVSTAWFIPTFIGM